MAREEQPKKPSLGEVLAKKEFLNEGQQVILAELINNLYRMVRLDDREFNLEFIKTFVSKYENGAPFGGDIVSPLLLGISALRDSKKLTEDMIKRLEYLEKWLMDIRGT